MGQHIGALDYLLPEEYVNTMRVLHNRSPQMPLEDFYSVLREELGWVRRSDTPMSIVLD